MSKPWNSGGKTYIHRQKDKKNRFTARIFEDRKTKKTNLQHVFLKTERQKKQILFDIKGPCQGVRKNKAYTGLHTIIKEEKTKRLNVNIQK